MNKAQQPSLFRSGLHACGRLLANPERIRRAQLGSRARIEFCVNPGLWLRWQDGQLSRCYALDDERIPLARWANEQPAARFSILAYRPGRRLVILDCERQRLLKGYAKKVHDRYSDNLLLGAQSARCARLSAPRLLDRLPALHAFAMDLSPGNPLKVCCAEQSTLQSLGIGLARFQQSSTRMSLQDRSSLSLFTGEDEQALLQTLGQRTDAALQGLPPNWSSLLPVLERRQPRAMDTQLCHRDLHDGQWLHSNTALTLLDFDSLCLAAPELDLGNLIAHLYLRVWQQPWYKPVLAGQMVRKVLNSYRQQRDPQHDALLFFSASAFLRLALVYAIRPRWQHLSPPLTNAAAAVLAGAPLSDLMEPQ